MTPERWRSVEALYHAAYATPAAERATFLAEACREDQALRRQVESLLNESSQDGFLAAPTLGAAAELGSSPPHTQPDMTGQSLGGYRLDALLGAGGMGEVYRSHDAKLGRDVAIKILPPAFTRHPDRLARFEREARMLAALNHPNICAIYGFEESGGVRFLVLELVEGVTLAQTLAHAANNDRKGGGLPPGQVLDVARQIAEGLEVAHEKGIIHRDLKPANIKITPGGAVKILDFGLAKIVGGDGPPSDLSNASAEDGVRGAGPIIGTAAYMSPEQARGLPVDKRTDIWSFGCVLYEIVTGRVAFPGDTMSDSIAKILEREPDWSALPAATPPAIRRLLLRCLMKDPKRRLRDIGDVRIEIEAIDAEVSGTSDVRQAPAGRAGAGLRWLPWVALTALAAGMIAREAWRTQPIGVAGDPLANATFSRVTNWEGTEEHSEISPDGRFVAFLADKAGQLDLWVSQLGTGRFDNLTLDAAPMRTPGNLLRSLGFNGDGSDIWFSPDRNPAQHNILLPLRGGTPRPFLSRGRSSPSWSPDNARLAFTDAIAVGDPLYIADRIGANPVPVNVLPRGKEAFVREGGHTHNPVWSLDGEWIYVVHGTGPTGRMDVWRIRPSGASPEQLTHQHADVNFLAPLDLRTLLYVGRAADWSGPWLWALDTESKVTRRVTVGLEHYTSVSASRDGRRVVATVARPTAGLWRVPLHDGPTDDRGVQPYPVLTERALAPRFAGTSMFYLSLSTRGTGDGLWRRQNGQEFEVTRGADGVLSEPAAVSPDGSRVAVVVRQHGKRHLAVMSADGTNSQTLATSIEIQGVAGQSAADWSPDGARIVAGGRDEQGPGLFMIPVDGGAPERLVAKDAFNPVWSPKGDWIAYATGFGGGGGRSLLRGVRPDGTDVALPELEVRVGGAHRFLPNGTGLVYLPSIQTKDFWLLDFATNTTRQLTHFSDRGFLNTFDVTPDGKYLVFDRTRQNSDIVRIDLPAK
jgi:Tol biopolymer transport system component/tRNA A-37 threonylcarbamoyl transferase component Bud32